MQFLNSLLYFGITIGILVFIHELGHYLAAKLSGMRVDRFSLGFPPRAIGFHFGTKKLQQKFLRDIKQSIFAHLTFHQIHHLLTEQQLSKTHDESLEFLATVFSIEENEIQHTVKNEKEYKPSHLMMNEEFFPSHIDERFKDELFDLFSNTQSLVDDFSEYLDIRDWKRFKEYYATDYCLSWLPIGGFVKINGMIDESFDTEFLHHKPKPWEFRARPLLQKMFVITAGVLMNLILALGIFWGINYTQGKNVLQTTEVSVRANSPASRFGFLLGDRILKINNTEVTNWNDVFETQHLAASTNENNGIVSFLFVRNGREQTISVDRSAINDTFGLFPRGILPKVNLVESGKPADKVGLQPNDIITAVNNKPIDFFSLSSTIHSYAGKEIALEWKHNGETKTANITVLDEGRIGIALDTANTIPTQHIQYSLLEALPIGIAYGIQICEVSYSNILQLITGKVSLKSSLAGPVRIAQMSAQAAENGVSQFLTFVGLLSISLAILNILPFPALDGGHFMFLLYEGIFRREIPVKVKLVIQQAGFYMLLLLMVIILYNDISNL